MSRIRLQLYFILCVSFGLSFRAAVAGEAAPRLAITKPGGGFLTTDGLSKVPLEVVVSSESPRISRIEVQADLGEISQTRVTSAHHARFLYQTPARVRSAVETLSIRLSFADGTNNTEIFSLTIPSPQKPTFALVLEPKTLSGGSEQKVALLARSEDPNVEAIEIRAERGGFDEYEWRSTGTFSERRAIFYPPVTPHDAPSFLNFIASAASPFGFSAENTALHFLAPIRVSLEVNRGAWLLIEGAERTYEPVKAAADGRTVIEDVLVRYGTPINAYEISNKKKTKKKRRKLPLRIPQGLVSRGSVAAIAGQAVADGGTGPTLLVAVTPPALGGPVLWPKVQVEGARLVEAISINRTLRALSIERPRDRATVSVLFDDVVVGTVELLPSDGSRIMFAETSRQPGERAALDLIVVNDAGARADAPLPRVKIEGGAELEALRYQRGTYRVSVPLTTPGKTGEVINVIAELPPAKTIAGDPVEFLRVVRTAELEGPPPAIAPEQSETETPAQSEDDAKVGVALATALTLGAGMPNRFLLGGGVALELRLPLLGGSIAVRTGIEHTQENSSGVVNLGGPSAMGTNPSNAHFRIASTSIPVDAGLVLFDTPGFELVARGGLAIRWLQGALSIAGDNAGGGRSVTINGRAGLEAGFSLGPGALFAALLADGLGANVNALSSDRVTLEGSLFALRADLGYRLWLRGPR